jgi:hypothetical protein
VIFKIEYSKEEQILIEYKKYTSEQLKLVRKLI